MIPGFLIKPLIIAAVVAALGGFMYYQHNRIETLKLEKVAYKNRADALEQTLQAYQDAFKDQVQALNTERQQEIRRQENLLRTLNLIGDLNENDNPAVPAASLSVIDSLYADSVQRPSH